MITLVLFVAMCSVTTNSQEVAFEELQDQQIEVLGSTNYTINERLPNSVTTLETENMSSTSALTDVDDDSTPIVETTSCTYYGGSQCCPILKPNSADAEYVSLLVIRSDT